MDFSYTPVSVVSDRFHLSNLFARWLMGPLGCGKSFAICYEILIRAAQQPISKFGTRRSKVIFVRNTRQMLTDTVLPILKSVFPEGIMGEWKVSESTYFVRVGNIECDILLRPLEDEQDIRRVLSINATFCVIDEWREIPVKIVNDIAGRAGRFPPKEEEGCAFSGIFGASNPPGEDSDWFEMLEDTRPEGWEVFKFPSARGPDATWRKFLPDGYYERLIEGGTPDYIRVMIDGLYGRSLAGRPVYEETFRHDFHVSKDPISYIKSQAYPIVIGLDFGRCYDDQTEVLTSTGWKYFKDVNESEQVATLHPETRAFEYTDINFKTEYDYDGDMLYWRGTNIDLCVTPEHRFPYTTRDKPDDLKWAAAEEMVGVQHRYAITSARTWVGTDPANLPLGLTAVEYARFMGWWMSDGCVDKETNRIAIAQIKPAPELTEVRSVLQRCGVTTHDYKTGFRCSSLELADHLKTFGGKHAGARWVPDTIMQASREVIEAFVMAYTAGDGHIRRNGEHTIWIQSAELAGQFQELGQKLGWGSSQRWQKGGTSRFKDGREVICAGGWVVQYKKGWERAELKASQFSRKHYTGKIYCLNVDYHTLCVRRGGKVSWNGNTPAAVFGQRNAMGQVMILSELYKENIGLERFLQDHVKPHLSALYSGMPVRIVGDPAGWAMTQLSELTAGKIFQQNNIPAEPASTNSSKIRIEVVERLLARQADGKAYYIIDPGCKMLIRGFNGGYKYKRRTDGTYEPEPQKTGKGGEYSHIHDANQYLCLGIDGLGGGYTKPQARPVKKSRHTYA